MDIATATTGRRWSYGACINLGLWAVALAMMLRLWRSGDWYFWRGPTAVGRPETTHQDASAELSPAMEARSAHALVQTPIEKPIVVSINELDDDPSVAVYDVELRRRHHHHH